MGIDNAAFEGVTLTLTARSGCTFSGTANITGVDINRPATDRMTGTWNFEFDGQPDITWDENGTGSELTDIVSGTDGDVTAAGFNGDIDAWSGRIQVDTTRYRTFSSAWAKNRNVTYSMGGQFSGTIQYGAADTAPVPEED